MVGRETGREIEALFFQSMPPPPPLHAASRQELCEYAPYFRSYQSGVQTNGKVCTGFLIDKFTSFGDAWNDGMVIISHGGGRSRPRANPTALQGQTSFILSSAFELADSQEDSDRQIASLIAAKEGRTPVVIIVGSAYPLADNLKFPGRYNVAGSYLVRGFWPSKEYTDAPPQPTSSQSLLQPTQSSRNYRIRYKFRFQMGHRTDLDTNQPWEQLYNPDYMAAWNYDSESGGVPPDISFAAFDLRSHSRKYDPTGDVNSTELGVPAALDCLICGRISSRIHWNFWKCANEECKAEPIVYNLARLSSFSPSSNTAPPLLFENSAPLHINPSLSAYLLAQPVFPSASVFYKNPVTVYAMPRGGGRIFHVRNPYHELGFEAADAILNAFLKAKDLPLSRRVFRNHQVAGFLSQQFSFNVGAAYRYAHFQPTSDFKDSPEPVKMAMKHINQLIPGFNLNELLILGYLKGQKMNFHSDDEPGLGSCVLSWSFGSNAEMCFRERIHSKRKRDSMETLSSEASTISTSDTSVEGSDPSSLLAFDPALATPLTQFSAKHKPSLKPASTPLQLAPATPKPLWPLSFLLHARLVSLPGIHPTRDSVVADCYIHHEPKAVSMPFNHDCNFDKELTVYRSRFFVNDALVADKVRGEFWTLGSPLTGGKEGVLEVRAVCAQSKVAIPNLDEEDDNGFTKDAEKQAWRASTQSAEVEKTQSIMDALTKTDRMGATANATPSTAKSKRVCLKILLRHGDLLIMDGNSVQKYYEHSIKPIDGIRFVVTARRIDS
ncbi:hypothetical protein BC830DRAFT_1084394 [Chytriomyces sp. MP71]|nr:hypothetical protein BC830DRAFT_1084394 [Chytriomyces sp. MP71]